MKALFFLVETSKVDCDIIYANPPFNYDSFFQTKEDEGEDIVGFCKERIELFLQQTNYCKFVIDYSWNRGHEIRIGLQHQPYQGFPCSYKKSPTS